MKLKPLKIAIALLLPLLALSLMAGAASAGCPCEGDGTPVPPPTETVSVDVSPGVGGEVEVAGQIPRSYPVTRTVEVGEHVSLAAVPAEGYYFVGWGGDLSGNENPTEARITAETEIVALFFPEEIISADSRLHLVFPAGTVVRDSQGEPLLGLDIAVAETPLPPPPEAYIIGLPYELGPQGTTFDQPVTLNFSYDPALIPDRVAEADLILGYYDPDAAQWLLLPSVVDVSSHTVIALVEHLSTFGVIAPEPPPLPAIFDAGELKVYPAEADIGELVTLGVLLTNSGEAEGSYALTLTVNGVVVETKDVVMAGGSQRVAFSVTGEEAGDYAVDINGLEGSFTVMKAPLLPIVLPAAVIWVILGLAIAALLISAVIAPLFLRRRDY